MKTSLKNSLRILLNFFVIIRICPVTNMANATKAVFKSGFGAGKGTVWLERLKYRGEYILMMFWNLWPNRFCYLLSDNVCLVESVHTRGGGKKTVTTLKMQAWFARVPIGHVTVWPLAVKGTLSNPPTRSAECNESTLILWTREWMDEWTNEWMNESINQSLKLDSIKSCFRLTLSSKN